MLVSASWCYPNVPTSNQASQPVAPSLKPSADPIESTSIVAAGMYPYTDLVKQNPLFCLDPSSGRVCLASSDDNNIVTPIDELL